MTPPVALRCGLVAADHAHVERQVALARDLAGEPDSRQRETWTAIVLPPPPADDPVFALVAGRVETAAPAPLNAVTAWRDRVAALSRRLLLDGIHVELPRSSDLAAEYVEATRLLASWHEPALSADARVALFGRDEVELELEAERARLIAGMLDLDRQCAATLARMGIGPTAAATGPVERLELPSGGAAEYWSREQIETEYREHWSPLERSLYRELIEIYKPHEVAVGQAARAAAGKVLAHRRRAALGGVVVGSVAA